MVYPIGFRQIRIYATLSDKISIQLTLLRPT